MVLAGAPDKSPLRNVSLGTSRSKTPSPQIRPKPSSGWPRPSPFSGQDHCPTPSALSCSRRVRQHRVPAVRRSAPTRVLRTNVFIQRIVSGEQICNEQFFTGLDRPERVDKNAGIVFDGLAVWRARVIEPARAMPPRLPSITRPSDSPKKNVCPSTPSRW